MTLRETGDSEGGDEGRSWGGGEECVEWEYRVVGGCVRGGGMLVGSGGANSSVRATSSTVSPPTR